MQIRKICIKSIAVLMAAIVMVSTPLSRFADTKGVSESHAVAPALITLGGLFGAIAGAYGLYVGIDKLADHVSGWEIWTSTNSEDAYAELQTIKKGVTNYVITKALMSSVAGYLGEQVVSDTVSHSFTGKTFNFNRLPSTEYTTAFMEYVETIKGKYTDGFGYPLFTYWTDDGTYRGVYKVVSIIDSRLENALSNYEYSSVEFALYDSNTYNKVKPVVFGFDEHGDIAFTYKGSLSAYNIGISTMEFSDGDVFVSTTQNTTDSPFYGVMNNICTITPFYVLPLRENQLSISTYDDLLSKSLYETSYVLDYKTHGNNALDNTDILEGAEVTQAQLEAIQQAVEREYSNVVQFPNSGGDNEEDNNPSNLDNAMFTALIANAVAQAVANTLKDMGYIKNPTDEPSGENVKEQLGNIQISLDGLIDAISQINPAQGLANIAQGIAELPQKITASVTDAIRSVFEDLFVPDEGAIQDKVDEITDKFAFADSLLTVVDDIDGALKNASGPPEIYIHFEDAEDSKYTPIGTLKLLSFEWYERYKPYGDALLSSMLWLFFLWKVRKRIAEIVQGLSVSGESDANASANSAIGIERGRSS